MFAATSTASTDGSLGIVLRTTPLRESDLLVVLYTDTHGRVSTVARGARRSQRRFAGALQLLVLGRYHLGRQRGELWDLDRAEVEREWTRIVDPIAVAHASYVAELVGGLLPAESPDPEALEIVVSLWDSLADGGPSPGALRVVELGLLDLGGHRPAIDRCAACGSPDLESGTVFDPTRGGAICRADAARSRGPGVRPFEPATRAYLTAIATLETPAAARAIDADPAWTRADQVAAREALVAMITGLIGRPLRSLEYLGKLSAAGRREGS